MKKSRRILGYVLLAAGIVAIIVGSSPIFPVFLEAFVVGGLLLGIGVWTLAGPGLRSSLRRAGTITGSSRRRAARPPVRPTVTDPLLPVRILRLAKERKGLLTVAEVAMGLDVPLDQAEAGLGECVRAGNAIPDYDVDRAHALYRFPEFSERD